MTASSIPIGATVPLQPAKMGVPLHQRRWNVVVAATAVVVLTCGIAYSGRHAASFLESLKLQGPIAIAVQEPLSTAKRVPSEGGSPFHTEQVQAREPRTATLLPREGTSEDEVVYIGNDVTVRYFTPRPTPHRFLVEKYEVVHIGKDVTVRYFTPMVRNTQRLKSNRPSQGASESRGLGTIAPSEIHATGAKTLD